MQFESESTQVNRVFYSRNSNLGQYLRLGMQFYQKHPEIQELIVKLQDSHALKKKRERQLEREPRQRQLNGLDVQSVKCLQLYELKNMESRIGKSSDLSFGQACIYDKHQGQFPGYPIGIQLLFLSYKFGITTPLI